MTAAALKTASLAILPAVSLNRIDPLPSCPAKVIASISKTEPKNPDTPSPKTLPISMLVWTLRKIKGVSRAERRTS